MDSFINKYNVLLSAIGMDEIERLIQYIIIDVDVNKKDINKMTEEEFYKYCSCYDESTVIQGLYISQKRYEFNEDDIDTSSWWEEDDDDMVDTSTNTKPTFVYSNDIISFIKVAIELYDEHSIEKEILDRILIVLNQMYEYVITDKKFDVFTYIGHFFYEMSQYVKDEISNFLVAREVKIYAKGDVVSLSKCEYTNPFGGVVEFCVDGQWGLMDTNNVVVLENHYDSKFSNLSQIDVNNEKFVIITIRKSSKKGVLSLATFSYIIDAGYDEIFPLNQDGCLYFEVNIGGTHGYSCVVDEFHGGIYGLFMSNGHELISCKYSTLNFKDEYIECDNYLFDRDGNLIIGGYSSLSIEANYLKIYFNLYNNRYEDSFCLVTDRTFHSILSHNGQKKKLQMGAIYNNLQEVLDIYPEDILLRSEVDLSYIENGFVILRNPNVEYQISEFLEYNDIKQEYLKASMNHGMLFEPLEFDVFCKSRYGYIPIHSCEKDEHQFPKCVDSVWHNIYIHQKEAVIIKVDQKSQKKWSVIVDEVYSYASNVIMYKKNDKIGIIANDTIYEPFFSGAALDSNIIAIVKKGNISNGTYYEELDETIQFFEIKYNNPILVTEVSDSIDPYNKFWYPEDFRKKYHLFVEDVDDREFNCFWNDRNTYLDDYVDDISEEEAIMRSLSGHGCDSEMFGY